LIESHPNPKTLIDSNFALSPIDRTFAAAKIAFS